ncbi:MAG: Hsp20/alpha crystallin family protein, partial [Planctomycetota bacterium]
MFPETLERGLIPRLPALSKRVPRADIVDGPNELTLHLDVPGFQESEIEISVDKRVLVVSARPGPVAESPAERKVLLRERTRAPLERAFKLLDEVDAEGISASLALGVR